MIKVGLVTEIIMAVLFLVVGYFLEPVFTDLIGTNDEMKAIFRKIYFFYVFIYIWCDYCLNLFSGLLKNIGKHNFAMIVYFIGVTIIGLVCAYLLGIYLNFGVIGVWQGMLIGLLFSIVIAGF